MKKKFFTLLVAFVLIFTTVLPALATDGTEADGSGERTVGTGGLDFYSITIHYDKPTLVSYIAKRSKYYFAYEGEEQQMATEFVLRAGVTKNNDYTFVGQTAGAGSNFKQLLSLADGIYAEAHYSKFPYTYAYITHIQDGGIIKSKDAVQIRGISALSDDAGNQNPNIIYNADGYAVDKDADTSGKNYFIDPNGYRIDDDYVYVDNNNRRVVLFYEEMEIYKTGVLKGSRPETNIRGTGKYYPVSLEDRLDENGKLLEIRDIEILYVASKIDYNNFLADDEAKVLPMVIDDGTIEYNRAQSRAATISLFRTVKSETETDEEYMSKDRKFTQADIFVDEMGRMINGTPVTGTPKMNSNITKITIEIDALGTQLYDNSADDPQNLNKITVSIGDWSSNVAAQLSALEQGLISESEVKGTILGTVSSQTTKTSMNWEKGEWNENLSPTAKSIDLNVPAEILNSLYGSAIFYLEFDIQTHQPEDAFNNSYIEWESKGTGTTLATKNVKKWVAPEPQEKPESKSLLDQIADGFLFKGELWVSLVIYGVIALIVIAVVVIIVVASAKGKKKKSAAQPKEINHVAVTEESVTDTETAAEAPKTERKDDTNTPEA